MSDEVNPSTDQPDPKAVVGGAFSAAAETYDHVVGFFAPFGRALVAAAAPDRGARSSTCPTAASIWSPAGS
jgi:hypothetical protein